jgi:hypothetical protein
MTKRLTLRRESLTELTTDDLRLAVGGLSGPTCAAGASCPILRCDMSDLLGCVMTHSTCETSPC